MSAVVKTAPTLLLSAVVLSWNGGRSVLGVAGGIILSAVGDWCLIWPELLLHGMCTFALAHLLYSVTFLSDRYATYSSTWTYFLYPILWLVGGGFYMYLYPYLQKLPDSDLLTPAVGVYVALITLMVTLAVRTHHAATLLGSLIFSVSDMALALQVFKALTPLTYGSHIVMGTYYLAQLLIAVGDVTAVAKKDDFSKWKRS